MRRREVTRPTHLLLFADLDLDLLVSEVELGRCYLALWPDEAVWSFDPGAKFGRRKLLDLRHRRSKGQFTETGSVADRQLPLACSGG